MRVLVCGGTGTVGSHVVRELIARGVEVDVLTRDAAKTGTLPAGAHGVVGDLLDPATVRSAFLGCDGLFLLNALSTTEAQEGLMAICGARLAAVGRIVYMSVQGVDAASHLPHFGAKIAIEAAVRASGIGYTILRPNSFVQNDLRYRQALLDYGVYPQPLGGVGVSRVDVRDIAEAAAIALTGDGARNETVDVAGPDVETGASIAANWSAALGRPVRYGGDDLDAWERQMLAFLPAWMVFDLRLMYAHFQERGLPATPQAIARLTDLLGHPPRDAATFVRESARQWLG